MAESTTKILEGVFAISKPPSLSSAQVLRNLQTQFATSKTFAPLLRETKRKEDEQARHQPKRRKRGSDHAFKIGHGGTLDPLATGVLIVGIGRGTKHLNNFLGCTKTYDTVVLFGKSTDTSDVAGKVVAQAPYTHITRELIDSKLEQFRGNIKQVPPIYSALKIQGVKAYEYARSGKELPRELESRDMNVEECTLLEWFDGGKHDFRWPAEEAPEEDKAVARKLLPQTQGLTKVVDDQTEGGESQNASEKPSSENDSSTIISTKTGISKDESLEALNTMPPFTKAALHTHALPQQCSAPADAPAARIRLTASSGFYVRSFAHDLGIACESLGIMSQLHRSRQGGFTTADPPAEGLISCLTYADLESGEEVWGPKVSAVLEQWVASNPDVSADVRRLDDRDRSQRQFASQRGRGDLGHSNRDGKRKWGHRDREGDDTRVRRRNSSSPE